MDPAAEPWQEREETQKKPDGLSFSSPQWSINIQDLIGLDDVMDELGFGPNGGLVYAMEYLMENLDWLEEQLGDFEDDNLIVDCPGQIEVRPSD
ncbi:GPN-loop GTPase 3 [Kappamyces sp. JEL0680]|nr:GPN-loop GTPase 3 [Kappamyces sp. JEL0680]